MPVLSQPAPAQGGATDSRPGSSGYSEPPPAVDAAGGEELDCPPWSYPSREEGGLPGLARDP
eukprot:539547-Hanusia_phi.AAC.1